MSPFKPSPDLPAFRKLRGYAFDPSLSQTLATNRINNIVYKVAWEEFPEPLAGEYIEIVDYDPTVGRYYEALDLNSPLVLAQDGLDPSESDPRFHQQMVYAVTMTTIANFERALGRRILWASRLLDSRKKGTPYEEYVPRLRLYPHALREANAYYSPPKKAILFGYFSAAPANDTLIMPNSLVFSCLSHDIIAHEVTHAILDGMHRNYNEPTNPDVLAFHEAFSDIVALFQHFSFPEVLRHQIARTRGNLSSQNLLGQLAQEFGTAIGSYGSLRDFIGGWDLVLQKWVPHQPSSDEYRTVTEPHARGSILVAAVFDAFLHIYDARVSDLLRIASGGSGILPDGEIHPDLVNRLADEAAKAAKHVLTMCIRAVDYCPPIDITFGDYLRGLITADMELVADDRLDYRLAFIDAFRRRGIYPEGLRTLSVDSVRLPVRNIRLEPNRTGDDPMMALIDFLRDYAEQIKYRNDRAEIYRVTRSFITGSPEYETGLHARLGAKFSGSAMFSYITGLAFHGDYAQVGVTSAGQQAEQQPPSFEIQNLRLVNRVGPEGTLTNQVVFSLIQTSHLDPETLEPVARKTNYTAFKGGCTLIFDLDTLSLRYAISKPLIDQESAHTTGRLQLNEARLSAQRAYLGAESLQTENPLSQFFLVDGRTGGEPFALLHQH